MIVKDTKTKGGCDLHESSSELCCIYPCLSDFKGCVDCTIGCLLSRPSGKKYSDEAEGTGQSGSVGSENVRY